MQRYAAIFFCWVISLAMIYGMSRLYTMAGMDPLVLYIGLLVFHEWQDARAIVDGKAKSA